MHAGPVDPTLASRLELLADAYARHGYDVRGNLRPGASADELAELESLLGLAPPAAYRDLYSWSAGTVDDSGPCLRFRDEALLPLARVAEERELLVETYGWFDGVDLGTLAPLATFEGATLAVACGPHDLTPLAAYPVISFFQGIEVFYDSIGSMVKTALDWVSQPDWAPYAPAPNELEIWRRHNRAVDF